jgi:hypothetical protein
MITKLVKPVSLREVHSVLWLTIVILSGLLSLVINLGIDNLSHTEPKSSGVITGDSKNLSIAT